MSDITQVLSEVSNGDKHAAARLLPLVYDELRALAQEHLNSERGDHTLQATALVHEAYLRLVDPDRVEPRDRMHFFALAAQTIRRVLIDYARGHRRAKRGGNAAKISLDDCPSLAINSNVDLLALDEALQSLAKINPRYAQTVEMRFFGGMTIAEIAQLQGVTKRTIDRDWEIARAWLYRELTKDDTCESNRKGEQCQQM